MKNINRSTRWNLFVSHRPLIHHQWMLCVLIFLGTYHPLHAQESTFKLYAFPFAYGQDPAGPADVTLHDTGQFVYVNLYYYFIGPELLTGWQVTIDTTGFAGWWGRPIQLLDIDCNVDADCTAYNYQELEARCLAADDPANPTEKKICSYAYVSETITITIPEESGGPFTNHTAAMVDNGSYGMTPVYSANIDTDPPKSAVDELIYAGSLVVYVPPGAAGTYRLKVIEDTQYTHWHSESLGESVELPMEFGSTSIIIDLPTGCCYFEMVEGCSMTHTWWCYDLGGSATVPCLGDCNNNGYDGACLFSLPREKKDCNFNDTFDGCEIEDNPSLDCNRNDYIDSCEIERGAIGDCNDNAIPDDCDLANGLDTDCNHNGIPDLCDLSLGIVPDCNNNGLPDDCEGGGTISGDCNNNGTLDTCDINLGTSLDVDGNCVPDECDAKAPPQGEPDSILNNRYLSFTPANVGCNSAIRVKLTSLYHPEPASTPRSDISSFEGEYRWVGPPSTYLENQSLPAYHFSAATTQCDPYFTNWNTINMLHVLGDAIVPSSSYEIQMVDQACGDLNDPNCYSDPLIVSTGKWGDVSEPFADEFNTSQPNIADVLSVVDKWLGTMNPPVVRAQLQPNIPNPLISVGISDVLYDVDAWLGTLYPLAGPTSCSP